MNNKKCTKMNTVTLNTPTPTQHRHVSTLQYYILVTSCSVVRATTKKLRMCVKLKHFAQINGITECVVPQTQL